MNRILKDDNGETVLIAKKPIRLICREATVGRLATTCFREEDRPLAGTFLRWSCIEEMLDDREVKEGFAVSLIESLDEVYRTYRRLGDRGATHSHEGSCTRPVGWSSIVSVDDLPDDVELQEFSPSKRSVGLRVTDREGPRALTDLYTIVYEVRYEAEAWAVVIHSAYPGPDIGDLDGDVSGREGVAFFDWLHPGEPLQAANAAADDQDIPATRRFDAASASSQPGL